MRVLLVEDDASLAESLMAALARSGIAADHAELAEEAELMLETAQYTALLLDLGLPDADGLTLLERLRKAGTALPVIALTARGAIGERIAGLDAGADDYLVKPFDFDELEARLRAILRRQAGLQSGALACGNVRLDSRSREMEVEGRRLAVSAREAAIAELLLRRPGRVVTRQLAEDQLFGHSEEFSSNAVEVYVHRLRKKLENAGADVRIETIRGVGYLLRPVD
ncbi:response regulator transcription factor [Novosphingobium profundi]|uniref:response regulator n=1 Tax=Novosphingobium profundi TaxID=1774954 RepID=UPI001BDB2A64|nr:response regulator transcription factor [Novosphingobium profundi]MBT0671301.1 response regulator transcription factor [Novosphingobium profundi]